MPLMLCSNDQATAAECFSFIFFSFFSFFLAQQISIKQAKHFFFFKRQRHIHSYSKTHHQPTRDSGDRNRAKSTRVTDLWLQFPFDAKMGMHVVLDSQTKCHDAIIIWCVAVQGWTCAPYNIQVTSFKKISNVSSSLAEDAQDKEVNCKQVTFIHYCIVDDFHSHFMKIESKRLGTSDD